MYMYTYIRIDKGYQRGTLHLQCSKLRVHPAPGVHISAAGCIGFETCAPEVFLQHSNRFIW